MTIELAITHAPSPAFVAHTSKAHQLWGAVVAGGGLSALMALVLLPYAPSGAWQAFIGVIAGVPLVVSAYVLLFTPRRELRIDASGWCISGDGDGAVPWADVWTYEFIPLPRSFSNSVIRVQLSVPHRESRRTKKCGKGAPRCHVWGDRSVDLIAVGWDKPAVAIFRAFEEHIENDRQRRKAAPHTTAVIPPST